MQKFGNMLLKSSREILSVPTMVICAMLTAMGVVLSFFSIYITESNKLSLTFVPIVLSSVFYGPVTAGFIGALIDVLGYLIKPMGAYFPGFTLSGFFVGFISGLILYEKPLSLVRVTLSCFLVDLFVHIGLNGLWLKILYNKAFVVSLAARCIKNAVLLPIEILILVFLGKALEKILPHVFHSKEKIKK